MWPTNGIYVCTAPGIKEYPVIVSSSGNGAIVAWDDSRNRGGAAGEEIYAQHINQSGGLTVVQQSMRDMPEQFALAQNYPNPFNPSTTIRFRIGASGFTSLKVYNMLGQEVATLVHEELQPGAYEANLDAQSLSSGMYFYKLQTGSYSDVKKMLLLK